MATVSTGRRAYLADFGLARVVASDTRLTRTGSAIGTPQYMSPEQVRGEISGLTAAADVWGLGVVLFEVLAGRPPFEGDTLSLMGRIVQEPPPPLRTLRPEIPAAVEAVLSGALAKRPPSRYPNGGAFRDALDEAARGGRPSRHQNRLLGMLAIGVTGACVALVGIARQARRLAPPLLAATGSGADALATRARATRDADPRQAAALYALALKDDPQRHDWRLEHGLCAWASGDPATARAEWARIPAETPEGPAARVCTGLLALARRDYPAAREAFTAARDRPGHEGRCACGALAFLEKDRPAARAALAGEPGWDAALLRALLEAADPAGDKPAAIRDFDFALAAGIPFGWALGERGAVRRELGDVEGAVRDFGAALRLDPGHAPTWFNRGLQREALGDLAGARTDLDEAIRLDGRDAIDYFVRGNVRRVLDDPAGAEADYGEVLARDPQHVGARVNRGNVRAALGNLRAAIADYDAALALDPGRATAWGNRGGAKHALGDVPGALADLDQSLARDPTVAACWLARARIRQQAGDLRGAHADFDAAIANGPEDPLAWRDRGRLLGAIGRFAEARADFDEALRLAPADAEVWCHRAEMRMKLGDMPGARADFTYALGIAPPDSPLRPKVEAILRELDGAR